MNLTTDRIANSILQRRKKYNNFVLVEGTQDRLFFLKFKEQNTQVEITFGWEKLIDIVTKLNERGFDKVIGIIDRDLREIIPENYVFDYNVILTDEHDINILCLEKTFSLIFSHHCSDEKTQNFEISKNCNNIKDYTHSLARPISFLRILNKRENLHLTFKSNDSKNNRLDYSKIIDKNKYEFVSLEKLVETIVNFSRNKTAGPIIANNLIVEKLKKLIEDENHDNPKLNSGHDFGEIICLGLKKVLGSTEINSEDFLKESVLGFDSQDFVKTEIYSKIKALEIRQSTIYLKF